MQFSVLILVASGYGLLFALLVAAEVNFFDNAQRFGLQAQHTVGDTRWTGAAGLHKLPGGKADVFGTIGGQVRHSAGKNYLDLGLNAEARVGRQTDAFVNVVAQASHDFGKDNNKDLYVNVGTLARPGEKPVFKANIGFQGDQGRTSWSAGLGIEGRPGEEPQPVATVALTVNLS